MTRFYESTDMQHGRVIILKGEEKLRVIMVKQNKPTSAEIREENRLLVFQASPAGHKRAKPLRSE